MPPPREKFYPISKAEEEKKEKKKKPREKSKVNLLLTKLKDSPQRVSCERDNLVGYSLLPAFNYFFHPSSTRSQRAILIPFPISRLHSLFSRSKQHSSEPFLPQAAGGYR